MGWRDDLAVGDFVIVDRFDSWTAEVVTRTSMTSIWTSRRDGKEERFTRSWGRSVGNRDAVLTPWSPTTELNLREREQRQAEAKQEEARREAHWRKSRRMLKINWVEMSDDTLDAVLRLVGEEP